MSAEAETKTGKEEAFLCPFCGAPYRELIPADTVQVKCRYCGATVLVPPRLGGGAKRCPNHPESLAVGLCGKCGESFCEHCLHIVPGESGVKVYYCPKCLQEIIGRKDIGVVLGFILFLITALPFFSVQGGAEIGLAILAVGFLFLIFAASYEPVYPTLYEKRIEGEGVEQEKQLEPRISEKKQLTPEEIEEAGKLYQKLWDLYRREREEQLLEDKIRWRMFTGESREEAIYSIARQRGLVE
jgi:DNA-directed RNA polymerase subunit RPC12/RpoP